MTLINYKDVVKKYIINKEYDKAEEFYNNILINNNNILINKNDILINKTLILLKLKKYKECINICSIILQNDNQNSIVWGRLGGALYGLEKYKESKCAYSKAYSLNNLEIYTIMINKIDNKLNNINNILDNNINNILDNNNVNNILDSIMNNDDLLNKLNNKKFQDKILQYQYNPFQMLKDNDMMGLMDDIVKNIKL
jgi:tetratricopeptide (TPR) repeat protein